MACSLTARPERPSRRDQRGPVATQALKSQTRLSFPPCQKLVDAYVSGMPVKRIAERFGAPSNHHHEDRHWRRVKVRSQPLASSTREEARHLYDSGRSLAQVAEQLGVSASAVRSAVLVAGGTLRPAGGSARNRARGDPAEGRLGRRPPAVPAAGSPDRDAVNARLASSTSRSQPPERRRTSCSRRASSAPTQWSAAQRPTSPPCRSALASTHFDTRVSPPVQLVPARPEK